jgi:putative transposase
VVSIWKKARTLSGFFCSSLNLDLLDKLLAGRDPKELFGKDGLVDELKKALSERILNTEIDEHLTAESAEGKDNHRNGYSKKSVLIGTSKVTLAGPAHSIPS